MAIDPVSASIAGAQLVASTGLSIFGANQAQKQAEEQAKLDNQKINKQHEYDLQLYKFNKVGVQKKYGDSIKKIELAAKNETMLANYKDANALDSYAQALKIKDLQQTAQNNAYTKSEKLYESQLSLNAAAAQYAKETQFAALQEEVAKFAVANNNLILENLLNSSKAQAASSAGGSKVKASQAFAAAKGAKQALSVDKGVESLGQSALMTLQKIQQDKNAADVNAFAQKLLPPQEIPDPLVPYKTPIAEYQYPDPPTKFDFGPIPQKGVMNTVGNSWLNTFSTYLPSIADSATALAQSFYQPQQQQTGSTFNPFTYSNSFTKPVNFSTTYSMPANTNVSTATAFAPNLNLGSTLNIPSINLGNLNLSTPSN